MKQLSETGNALRIRSPATFPVVEKGGNRIRNLDDNSSHNLYKEEDLVQSNSGGYYDIVSHGKATNDSNIKKQPRLSPLDRARRASNKAVMKVLQEDWQTDDGFASPSDLWLDRGSGFDESNLCRSAEQVHTVPSLRYNIKMDELEISTLEDYSEKASLRHSNHNHDYDTVTATSANTNIEEVGDGLENNSLHSTTVVKDVDVFEQFQNATFSSASSAWNAGAEESNIMDLHEDDTSIITSSTIFTNTASQPARKNTSPYPYNTTSQQFKVQDVESSAPRLHAATGSQPFLCELLHDSYGVGNEPPRNDPGSYFSAVNTVGELLYFNSDQECYKKTTSTSEDGMENDAYAGSASTTNWEAGSVSMKKGSSISGSSFRSKDDARKIPSSSSKKKNRTLSRSIPPIIESLQIEKTPITKPSSQSNPPSITITSSPNLEDPNISLPKLLDTRLSLTETEEEGISLKEQIRLFSPKPPNSDSKQPSNGNPLRLPDNLPLNAVVSPFQTTLTNER